MSGRRPAVGRGACDCSNIDIMQLFHELKQQFPAVPDEVVSACISDNCHDRPACRARLQRELETLPRALVYPPALMGAASRTPSTAVAASQRTDADGSDHVPDSAVHRLEHEPPKPSVASRKPPPSSIRSPEAAKPPISPSTSKRFVARNSPTSSRRVNKLPETPSPPTSTGAIRRTPAVRPSTLDLPKRTEAQEASRAAGASVNLSVKVDCSVDLSPSHERRRSTVLQVTPEPAWTRPTGTPPRNCYTSVNLTLRTPTSAGPQQPIDICSHNSSLTYTTSSFDSRQGTQSELRITVGPDGVNSVSAVRTQLAPAPFPPQGQSVQPMMTPAPNSTATKDNLVLVSRQLERKELLGNELLASKDRLCALRKEVATLRLENTPEFREKLKREIKHLRSQCERLTREVDRHPDPTEPQSAPRPQSVDEPRWPCGLCTFRNHPLMNKCEQCDMPRLLLVSAGPGENIHIRFSPGNSTRVIHSWVV